MAEYVYPAVFHLNDDKTYTVTFPDLPGCITEGKSPEEALYMAQSALTQWIEYLADSGEAIPVASASADVAGSISAGEEVRCCTTSIKT
ncbi:MAG: type II toxin-antitoxin system HicB family antitoxin [Oscillospiraceae bacterium]|nr:type II toxin-antitoxin system HicB family antitoxin [Oscillospiraceae bacterium]